MSNIGNDEGSISTVDDGLSISNHSNHSHHSHYSHQSLTPSYHTYASSAAPPSNNGYEPHYPHHQYPPPPPSPYYHPPYHPPHHPPVSASIWPWTWTWAWGTWSSGGGGGGDGGHVWSPYLPSRKSCMETSVVFAFFLALLYLVDSTGTNSPASIAASYSRLDSMSRVKVPKSSLSGETFESLQQHDYQHEYESEYESKSKQKEEQSSTSTEGALSQCRDVSEARPSSKSSKRDVAFFFHVPASAGEVLKDIFSTCYLHLVKAEISSGFGDAGQKLQILSTRKPPKNTQDFRGAAELYGLLLQPQNEHHEHHQHHAHQPLDRRLDDNNDTTTTNNNSPEPDLIYSSTLTPQSLTLALQRTQTSNRNLRLLTLLRHPIQRSHALYHYISQATWEPSYFPALAGMSLEEVVDLGTVLQDNWITRTLAGVALGMEVRDEHVDKAAQVLRDKFLVGLAEEMEESWFRIRNAFGWDGSGGARECADNGIWRNYVEGRDYHHPYHDGDGGDVDYHGGNQRRWEVLPGSVEWNILEKINRYDLVLYEQAKRIFREQDALFYTPAEMEERSSREDEDRLRDDEGELPLADISYGSVVEEEGNVWMDMDAVESMDTIEQIVLMEPMENMEAMENMEPMDPVDPMEPTEQSDEEIPSMETENEAEVSTLP